MLQTAGKRVVSEANMGAHHRRSRMDRSRKRADVPRGSSAQRVSTNDERVHGR